LLYALHLLLINFLLLQLENPSFVLLAKTGYLVLFEGEDAVVFKPEEHYLLEVTFCCFEQILEIEYFGQFNYFQYLT
jgi:hypothetical protein